MSDRTIPLLVPVGSPVGQNEAPVPIGSHTQPREPIGDKKMISRLAVVRIVCDSL
jgi:hypothetical protein